MTQAQRKPAIDSPAQILLFADVLPNGSGGLTVVPRKSLPREVSTEEAAELLGVCRTTMYALRNDPRAMKTLRWRFTTPSKRIVLYELESVLAYREATKQWED